MPPPNRALFLTKIDFSVSGRVLEVAIAPPFVPALFSENILEIKCVLYNISLWKEIAPPDVCDFP